MGERPQLSKAWIKVPLMIRAVLVGLAVSTLGVFSWSLIATLVPMPWSFAMMLGLLWVYWKYFSGSWMPESTKAVRAANFRRIDLSTLEWLLALGAALLVVLNEQAGLIVTFRIMAFPAERFAQAYSFLDNVPAWAAWLVVIMISAVAGICEETGFRGYMQTPMEKRYGSLGAICIVSVVFVLVHLHQAWSGPIIVQIFYISTLFGTLAYCSRSLVPGIIAHFLMDICNFSFWWTRLGLQFDRAPIGKTGMDLHFVCWSAVFAASLMLFGYLAYRLTSITAGIPIDAAPADQAMWRTISDVEDSRRISPDI